jgi:hypothetical protein
LYQGAEEDIWNSVCGNNMRLGKTAYIGTKRFGFLCCTYYYGDEVKWYVIGGKCGMHERDEK